MTIYTRTGDEGETDLIGGVRAPKDALRLEVCGDFDELDAWLGLARCEPLPGDAATLLERVQRRMVAVRARLADARSPQNAPDAVTAEDVETIERAIDRFEATLEPIKTFILPAGNRAAATLHVARAVCRRAERRLVTFARTEPDAVAPPLLAAVNRLSDLLFVLARAANAQAGVADVPY